MQARGLYKRICQGLVRQIHEMRLGITVLSPGVFRTVSIGQYPDMGHERLGWCGELGLGDNNVCQYAQGLDGRQIGPGLC